MMVHAMQSCAFDIPKVPSIPAEPVSIGKTGEVDQSNTIVVEEVEQMDKQSIYQPRRSPETSPLDEPAELSVAKAVYSKYCVPLLETHMGVLAGLNESHDKGLVHRFVFKVFKKSEISA
jgi:hypothetical protein